ncbi:hypothetical protein BD324DRAFT_610594 [Kockovaella imperatae]|uniref:Uncharacterized protein n=1 Tax=Kockovaella imperatae TaxID=4999 RepID=A0A1Y1U666_9TREE|nr:hypothetical protein BD324DRAFT_610594 [Kockovaella imperatae]ORX33492.1 hypothetical protein BD324DRAFT_610594 [Kockovaella imperatae]
MAELDMEARDFDAARSPLAAYLRKRITPQQIASMQAAEQQQAAQNQAQQQPQQQTSTGRMAAQAATKGTTIASSQLSTVPVGQQHGTTPGRNGPATTTTSAYSFYNKFGGTTLSTSSAKPASSSAVKVLTSSSSSSASPSFSPIPTSTSTRGVLTIIETPSVKSTATVATSSSARPSADTAEDATQSTKMSSGHVAGAVIGVLIALLLVGAAAGWLYRKWSGRKYSVHNRSWSKMQEDDISPFPPNEKLMASHNDDIYGASAAPVIGSRRALALARQNAFNPDGSYRDSEYLAANGNRAGYGAGHSADQGPYRSHPLEQLDSRGYSAAANGSPHMYSDQFDSDSPHALSPPMGGHGAATRQLLGPAPIDPPYGMPSMAMGRPAAPETEDDFAHLYQYGDMPSTHSPFGDDKEVPYTPHTATTMGEWRGDAKHPLGAPLRPTRPGDEHRRHSPPTQDRSITPPSQAARALSPPPPPPIAKDYPHTATAPPAVLPDIRPMSSIRMSTFDLRTESRPMTMYEDESAQQKRMYGEVASAAGVLEPPTPKLNTSTSSRTSDAGNTTHSSFSAHEMPARLPMLHLDPPAPYVHGQPLSPLAEVDTPRSGISKTTIQTDRAASPLGQHATRDENPFERTLVAARQNIQPSQSDVGLAPPFGDGPAFPSPAFPPPSPGGMSVPGSVTDSPRRWSGSGARAERAESRGVSMFYGEDAYGGI